MLCHRSPSGSHCKLMDAGRWEAAFSGQSTLQQHQLKWRYTIWSLIICWWHAWQFKIPGDIMVSSFHRIGFVFYLSSMFRPANTDLENKYSFISSTAISMICHVKQHWWGIAFISLKSENSHFLVTDKPATQNFLLFSKSSNKASATHQGPTGLVPLASAAAGRWLLGSAGTTSSAQQSDTCRS